MTVLKIVGIVLATIVVLLMLIMMLPVRVRVKFNGVGEYFFGVKVSFIPVFSEYNGKTKKDKRKKEKKDSEKKKKDGSSSKFSDILGLRELFEGGDIFEALSEGIRIITDILREIGEMLPGCKVKKLKVSAVFSGDDPAKEAMTYGLACAAFYPFIGVIQSFMKVSEDGTEVDMRCAFGEEEASVIFETLVSASVFSLVRTAVRIIVEQVKNAVMKEGK